MSEYRILSGPGAESFSLLPRVSLNSSSVSSLSGPLCARVLQICWDHSVHASFPLSCFGCSVLWITQIKLDLSLRWSLALPCLCLQSLGLFWYDHFLPFVGRIARSVSVVSALSSSRKLFRFRFFCLWCYLLELLSFGVHCSFELLGVGLVEFFLSASFSLRHVFLSNIFSISLCHHSGCLLLFRKPFALCLGFHLRSFDTMSEPDLSYYKGLCGLMFCFLSVFCFCFAFCRLNTTGR